MLATSQVESIGLFCRIKLVIPAGAILSRLLRLVIIALFDIVNTPPIEATSSSPLKLVSASLLSIVKYPPTEMILFSPLRSVKAVLVVIIRSPPTEVRAVSPFKLVMLPATDSSMVRFPVRAVQPTKLQEKLSMSV